MKSILLLTDFYHFNPSANGICIEKIAESLIKKGYKVSVLAYKIGKSNSYENISGVDVYRVRAPLFYQVREWNKGKGYSNIIFQLFRYIRYLHIILFLPIYPLIYPIFAVRYKNLAQKVIKNNNIDEIIAEYIPIEALYAGLKIKKKHPDILFQVYIVDTFTQSPNALNYKIIGKVSKAWEMKMIQECDNYFFIENFDDYYSDSNYQDFRKKMHSVGFPLIQDNHINLRIREDSINFLYTGSWGGERNPENILNVLKMLKRAKNVNFFYCGKENSTALEMKTKYEFLVLCGYKQQHELEEVYAKIDILISIGNSTNMIPSKIFSYISTGLPILHFYLNENDPCISLLQKYNYARTIDLKKVTIKEVEKAIDEIIDKRVEYEQIEKHFDKYTAETIALQLLKDSI